MTKTALITGVTGQDGAYLSEFLLSKGYSVHGLVRHSSTSNKTRLKTLLADHIQDIHFHTGDLTDASSIQKILLRVKPDEVYNLASQSHVHVSFDIPEYTGNVNALGALRLLESLRMLDMSNHCRFYQASTSELFGNAVETPQSESTPFAPRSPYGFAKLYAFWAVKNYRDAYSMHASNGILFNHESPLRGDGFVSKKIVKTIVEIQNGAEKELILGNLDAARDWGHSKDYVRGMWLMLQQELPDDYILATGKAVTVRDFVEKTFSYFNRSIKWEGEGVDEKGYDLDSGICLVRVCPSLMRPTDVNALLGNPARAKEKLSWKSSIPLEEMIEDMVLHEQKNS